MLGRLFRGRLWSHVDFIKLWIGQSVSELGSQVSLLAVPTVAILVLQATPLQVGVLSALEFLPFPVLGLVAGVWADRIRRRPILVVCDIVRTLSLGSIPIAFYLGVLGMPQLYAVALVTGVCTVFFDVAYQSYLPALIDRTDLVEGNSKLEVTRSLAQVFGPAVAGVLIQTVRAAAAIIVDSLSYVVSVVSVLLIRQPEPPPQPGLASGRTGFFVEMGEGLGVVLRNPTLRRIAGCTGTSNLGTFMMLAVYLIFTYRLLHLSPGTVGVIFAVGGIGAVVGALLAFPVARRLGLGPTLVAAILVGGAANFLVPLASGAVAVPLLMISGFVFSLTSPIYNINQVSLRQAITPDRVQGRMNATMRTIVWGTIPIGSALGGTLGQWVGVIPTLFIGASLATAAGLWVAGGDVLRLREQPQPASA